MLPKTETHGVKDYYSGRFLSLQLTPTVLILPATGGKCYRYTRTLFRGENEYFRCTRCVSLRQRDGGKTPLAKVTVRAGEVVSSADLEHHPEL